MEITKNTAVEEIIEALKQEHGILYNTLDKKQPFKLFRKDSGFGSYMFLSHEDKIIISLKLAIDHESQVFAKQLITNALEKLGYIVE
jgi:hypothetical protein